MDSEIKQHNILVIGVGNEFRSDDRAGIVLARMVKQQGLPGVNVIEESGEGAQLMEVWKYASAVILIDAVSSGELPGTLFRLDAHKQKIPSRFFSYSTHAFSLAESIELSRALNELPLHCVVFGVEGKNYSFGESLSEEVHAVLKEALEDIIGEIQSMKEKLLGEELYA